MFRRVFLVVFVAAITYRACDFAASAEESKECNRAALVKAERDVVEAEDRLWKTLDPKEEQLLHSLVNTAVAAAKAARTLCSLPDPAKDVAKASPIELADDPFEPDSALSKWYTNPAGCLVLDDCGPMPEEGK